MMTRSASSLCAVGTTPSADANSSSPPVEMTKQRAPGASSAGKRPRFSSVRATSPEVTRKSYSSGSKPNAAIRSALAAPVRPELERTTTLTPRDFSADRASLAPGYGLRPSCSTPYWSKNTALKEDGIAMKRDTALNPNCEGFAAQEEPLPRMPLATPQV